jgi:hypothetical protein
MPALARLGIQPFEQAQNLGAIGVNGVDDGLANGVWRPRRTKNFKPSAADGSQLKTRVAGGAENKKRRVRCFGAPIPVRDHSPTCA